jgi:hypothetical protein
MKRMNEGLPGGTDYLLEELDGFLLHLLGSRPNVRISQAALDLPQIVAQLGKDLNERDRGTLRLEKLQEPPSLQYRLCLRVGKLPSLPLMPACGPAIGIGCNASLQFHCGLENILLYPKDVRAPPLKGQGAVL